MYTAFARALARGADKTWVHGVFGFGLQPDIVFYLDAKIETLVQRVLTYDPYYQKMEEEGIAREILDYWESGMDMKLGLDYYDSFINYQKRMLSEFRTMADEFGFATIDTDSLSIDDVNKLLKKTIKAIL
jgi:dTMP kinase